MADLPIFDSHMHVWDLKQLHLPWLKDFPALNKTFSIADYQRSAQNYDLVKSIYVEVNVEDSQLKKELDFAMQLCQDKNNPIVGMIIGGEMESDRFESYLKSVLPNPYIKGVRRVLWPANIPKGFCLEPQFVKNVQLLGQHQLLFQACVTPDKMDDIVSLADLCPNTSFVLDHMGNGGLQGGAIWKKGIQELGNKTNVIGCKISGMVESATSWKAQDLLENFNICLDAFGENRLLFGSNWPVVTLNSSFEEWVEALLQILSDRSDAFIHKFFYQTAENIYLQKDHFALGNKIG